jgi:hypothetical protein
MTPFRACSLSPASAPFDVAVGHDEVFALVTCRSRNKLRFLWFRWLFHVKSYTVTLSFWGWPVPVYFVRLDLLHNLQILRNLELNNSIRMTLSSLTVNARNLTNFFRYWFFNILKSFALRRI